MDAVDPYGKALSVKPVPKQKGFAEKVKKVRKFRKSIRVDLDRKPELGGVHEERYLPPGSIKEVYEQYCSLEAHPASFVTFYRVA